MVERFRAGRNTRGAATGPGPAITLLWLEESSPATAAGLHLLGTRTRLEALGIQPVRTIARTSTEGSATSRLTRLSALMFEGIGSASSGTLLARWHPLMLPVVLAWRWRRGRVIFLVQGNPTDALDSRKMPGLRTILHKLSLASLKRAHGIAVTTAALQPLVAEMSGRSTSSVAVLPNGALQAEAADAHVPAASEALKPYAIFVGSMATWQGLPCLAKAKRSSTWPRGLRLVLIGDGVDAHEARLLADSDPGTAWLGRLPREESAAWIRGAEIGLSPKRLDEATRLGVSAFKVFEYAMEGVPIVATDVPGQAEAVRELGSGVLVPPDAPQALARAVAQLHGDEAKRSAMAKAGRSNLSSFDWRAHAHVLRDLIDSATR